MYLSEATEETSRFSGGGMLPSHPRWAKHVNLSAGFILRGAALPGTKPLIPGNITEYPTRTSVPSEQRESGDPTAILCSPASPKSGLLLANRDVRFYEQVKCPLAFGFSSPSALREIAVAGAVGKWESRVVGGIPKRSVFSTALGRRFCFVALPTEPPHQVRSVIHTQPPVRVLAHQHSAARQRTAPAHPIHLQDPLAHRQSVVPVHHALVLHREDALQVFPASRRKRALRLRRRHRKAPVELRQVTLPQKAVGFVHRANPAQPQLLRQTPLPGAEVPLAAPPRLRRIRRNHLHPQIPQRAPHLRHPLPVHHLPGLRRQPEVTGPIAIQSAENPAPLHHLAQRLKHRLGRFLLHQLRVIDLAGGVIQHHDQVVPLLIPQPAMRTAVDVQQHPDHRSPLAPPPMHAALPRLDRQPRSLQRQLHPGVAELDPVLLAQLLVKVPHTEIAILLPIQPQHLFGERQRHTAGTGLPGAPVIQPVVAILPVAVIQPPQLPRADAQDVRRFKPVDLLAYGSQNHFLYFHGPLPGSPWVNAHCRFLRPPGYFRLPLKSGHFTC